MKPFDIVVAVDRKGGIGKNGTLPWHLPADLRHFRNITTEVRNPSQKNAVIMGRKTWESIPESRRPLKDRINIVLTRQAGYALPPDVSRAGSLEEAMEMLSSGPLAGLVEQVYVIGGAEVFRQALGRPECRALYLTRLEQDFGCDVFFPDFKAAFRLEKATGPQKENTISYSFQKYLKNF